MAHLIIALTALTAALAAGAAALAGRRIPLRALGRWLVRNDPSDGVATAIVLVVSEPLPRAKQAARSFLEARAPRILIVRTRGGELESMGLVPNESEMTRELLVRLGVPREAVTIVEDADDTSTATEARSYKRYLLAEGSAPHRLIVVTSWYHGRRAGWMYEQIFRDVGTVIEVAAAPHARSSPEDWWRHQASFLAVTVEYARCVYYRLRSF